MNHLDRDTQELIARVKNVGSERGTKDRARERVLRAAALGTLSTTAAAASGTSSLLGPALGALLIGAAVGGVVSGVPIAVSERHPEAPVPARAPVEAAKHARGAALEQQPHTVAQEVVSTAELEPASPATPPVASPATPRVIVPAEPPVPSIERETLLLTAAQRALRSGEPEAALENLDRYQAEFPNGALGEEASGARAVAVCSLGDVENGSRALANFEQRYPRSPLLARVRAACEKP